MEHNPRLIIYMEWKEKAKDKSGQDNIDTKMKEEKE